MSLSDAVCLSAGLAVLLTILILDDFTSGHLTALVVTPKSDGEALASCVRLSRRAESLLITGFRKCSAGLDSLRCHSFGAFLPLQLDRH
jgi:hypothetical protein